MIDEGSKKPLEQFSFFLDAVIPHGRAEHCSRSCVRLLLPAKPRNIEQFFSVLGAAVASSRHESTRNVKIRNGSKEERRAVTHDMMKRRQESFHRRRFQFINVPVVIVRGRELESSGSQRASRERRTQQQRGAEVERFSTPNKRKEGGGPQRSWREKKKYSVRQGVGEGEEKLDLSLDFLDSRRVMPEKRLWSIYYALRGQCATCLLY